MHIRSRMVAAFLGVVSVGAVMAMSPTGGAPGGRRAAMISSSTACDQATTMSRLSVKTVSPYLATVQLADYVATLDSGVKQACAGILTCDAATSVVSRLRSIRAGLLPADGEDQIRAAEDQLLRFLCSS
jgi:hypothetical protein